MESNVTRVCRALQTKSEDGMPQIVYYQAGLGSLNNIYSYIIGGYLGSGTISMHDGSALSLANLL